MEINTVQKMRNYIDALEKTNRNLILALRAMCQRAVSANQEMARPSTENANQDESLDPDDYAAILKKSDVLRRIMNQLTKMSTEEQLEILNKLSEKTADKSRTDTRKPFKNVVHYTVGDRIYNDFIKDVSASGMFIESGILFSPGQNVLLTFPCPEKRKHVKIGGQVARTTRNGIGVKFNIANEEQEALIKSLMQDLV